MDLSIPLANSNCRDQYRNARSSTACSAGTGTSSGNLEQSVRRLADQQYRVMETGSNAKMLGNEIATTLGGRFVIREVWRFSFEDYLSWS